ncbi:MAG: hypothetical protein AM324_014440 [Candidatus Thorarchaeota archaeon SMTZ1-83]|nr:MAG: hypothetical protein AM324_15560 [Candidatus Thorarchaeota archaeon SMTZ1-83]
MSRLEYGWEKVVATKKVQDWLADDSSKVLQLTMSDFSEAGQQPGKMTLDYSAVELPATLNKLGVEPFGNLTGGYVLIKRKDTVLPTLFPKLEEPTEQYVGMPFYTLPRHDYLRKGASGFVNGEDGVNLAWSVGVLQSFLSECFSPFESFTLGGRLEARTKGELKILGQTFPLDAVAEADGYLESERHIVVLAARQSSYQTPLSGFSIHHLVRPLIHVRSQTDKLSSGLLLDWSAETEADHSTVRFGLYHYDFPSTGTGVNPFDYKLTKSKSYIILA